MPNIDLPTQRDARAVIPPTFQRTVRRSLARGPDAGFPSRPLLGVLPLKRLIPQDIHSLLDYTNAFTVAGVAVSAEDDTARVAGLALGLSVAGVSLLTDYRLSLEKLIPIEVHEATDYLWSFATIAAPFVLGYAKRSPLVALVHIAVGVSTILGSLLTDYRAQKGVRWSGKPRLPDLSPHAALGVEVGT